MAIFKQSFHFFLFNKIFLRENKRNAANFQIGALFPWKISEHAVSLKYWTSSFWIINIIERCVNLFIISYKIPFMDRFSMTKSLRILRCNKLMIKNNFIPCNISHPRHSHWLCVIPFTFIRRVLLCTFILLRM